jgi:hypothetical protein
VEGADNFELELGDASGTACASHAHFQVGELGHRALKAIYAVAKAGDMVIIVEGSDVPVILTAPHQRHNLRRNLGVSPC